MYKKPFTFVFLITQRWFKIISSKLHRILPKNFSKNYKPFENDSYITKKLKDSRFHLQNIYHILKTISGQNCASFNHIRTRKILPDLNLNYIKLFVSQKYYCTFRISTYLCTYEYQSIIIKLYCNVMCTIMYESCEGEKEDIIKSQNLRNTIILCH